MISKTYVTLFCCCLAFINKAIASDVEPIVSLPNGLVKGKLTHSTVSNSTTTFYSFLGLRYAQPPTGKARFLAPVEVQPWNDTYDATYEKHKCYQVGLEDEMQSEDCLFLNIFSPKLPDKNSSSLLSVLFYIHGGGFVTGSGLITGSQVAPDFFMDYEVILVSTNYRLGPFGFFSTGDGVIPGNAGLKDQNLALKWVNKNIEYFGGDPNQITIFGESAGSASVSYHILSPKSAGLFQAAILESGSSLSPWAYQRDQISYTWATAAKLNTTYNVTGLTSEELLDYFISADGDAIHDASQFVETSQNIQIQQGFYFAPVIEPEEEDAFLTKPMYELFENGEYNKVPVIIGVNAEEAVFFNADYFHWTQEAFDADIKLCVPRDMHLSKQNQTVVGQLIKDKYLGNNTAWIDNLLGSIQYFTDQSFARSIIKQAELQSKYSDVYFYVFSHHGKMGLNNVTLEGSGNVRHGEELPYLFPMSDNGLYTANLTEFPQEDVTVHYRFLSLWTNFAKQLNPTPKTDELINVVWPRVNVTGGADFQYLDLGQDLSVKVNPKSDKYQFWQTVYDQYAVPPYDTY